MRPFFLSLIVVGIALVWWRHQMTVGENDPSFKDQVQALLHQRRVGVVEGVSDNELPEKMWEVVELVEEFAGVLPAFFSCDHNLARLWSEHSTPPQCAERHVVSGDTAQSMFSGKRRGLFRTVSTDGSMWMTSLGSGWPLRAEPDHVVLQVKRGSLTVRLTEPGGVAMHPLLHPYARQALKPLPSYPRVLHVDAGHSLVLPAFVPHSLECRAPLCVGAISRVAPEEALVYEVARQLVHSEPVTLLNFTNAELCAVYRERWQWLLSSRIEAEWTCLMEGNDPKVKATVEWLNLGFQGAVPALEPLFADIEPAIARELKYDLIEEIAFEEMHGLPLCVGSFLRSACVRIKIGVA